LQSTNKAGAEGLSAEILDAWSQTIFELLAAHKELTELSDGLVDKLGYLC